MLSPTATFGPTFELPEVDERLVAPGTRYEIEDGKVVYVPPADELHGVTHSRLNSLVHAHRAAGYSVAMMMLTRVSQLDDFAPDLSIYPTARAPRTGGRQLEELAFQLVSTAALPRAGVRAAKLATRGVRRVLAIDVERARALEWVKELSAWSALDPRGALEDPALDVPLPIEALFDDARADDANLHALCTCQRPLSAVDHAIVHALRAKRDHRLSAS